MASANVRWPFYSSPFSAIYALSSIKKVSFTPLSLASISMLKIPSPFEATNVSQTLFSGYQCGLLPKEEPFKTKVELPLISSYVYLIHSLLRMYEL